uniref:Signal recognition particle receptor FtsY n=1 Tax=Desulfovibrio sp. U5L TaxID=596152 RepID=I2Q0T7_9BACT
MGFFSKLKKFWKADEAPSEAAETKTPEPAAAPAPAPQPQPPAEALETTVGADRQATPESTSEPAAVPAPSPEPVAVPPAGPEPEPEAAWAVPAQPDEPTPTLEPAITPVPAPKPEAGPAVKPETEIFRPEPTPSPVAEASPPQPAPVPEPDAAGPQATPAPKPERPADRIPEEPVPAAGPQTAAVAKPQDSAPAPWRNALTLELRQAEPRLSVWLDILLASVETPGPALWERLRFLFESLEAPSAEADAFVAKFADWLALMEYDEVELFRSELQYRLALALDLEDEEDERNRLFLKLSEGLAKTKEQIVKRIDGLLGSHAVIDEAFWEELEEILLMADVGFEPAAKLLGSLRAEVRRRGTTDPAVFKEILRHELSEIFRTPKTIRTFNPPEVIMMIGVNGVGKTTTIAKLAHRDIMRGKKVLIAAGDTFRAAAIEQMQIWAKRVGAGFYTKGEGSDPAAVAFEAMDRALAEGVDVLYLDTAGRLHTKANLMEELKKIRRVLGKKHPGAPHRSILVLDATTGQNALSQTRLFNEAAGVDEIILTKLDGTAKGGVVVGIALSFGIPITYVGLGEKMEDLRPFDGQDFAQALLGVE